MNNFPAMTEEQRQEMIEWAKGYIYAAEIYVASNPADRSGKAYLELLQIALAALTAEPEVWIKPDSLGFPRLAGIDAVTIPYVPEYPIPLYTAPPAPVLRVPVDFSELDRLAGKFLQASVERGGRVSSAYAECAHLLATEVKLLRAAGYEVKQ